MPLAHWWWQNLDKAFSLTQFSFYWGKDTQIKQALGLK